MTDINLTLIKKNPLVITTLIASKMGLFEKNNINVNLRLLEDFFIEGNNDFYDGKSDAMIGDVTFFFYMLERGKNAVITSNLTRTISLVGGKDLPKDLTGIKVGVNRSGLFRLYLENDLEDIVPDAEVVWINNTYDRINALNDKEIHALVAIEPFVTDVIEQGGKMIWNSRNSDKNLVMWCFDEEFYLKNKDAVSKFHNALEEAGEIFNRLSPDDKIKICIDSAGYSIEAARRLKNFEFEKQNSFKAKDFNLCQEWMFREKEITKLYDIDRCIVNIFD